MTPPRPPPHTAEFVTLRDYIDLQIDTIHKSTATAYQALEKQLDGMNHVTKKVEFEAFKERIDNDIRSLRESRAEMQGKASQTSVIIATVISALGLGLAIIGLLLRFAGM